LGRARSAGGESFRAGLLSRLAPRSGFGCFAARAEQESGRPRAAAELA
jgi:hypothetical protein